MKLTLLSILFLLLPKLVFSQLSENDKLIFLDSIYVEVKSDNYLYYRIIKDYKIDKESYAFKDFYKSGNLLIEGKTSDRDYMTKEGRVVYYYGNGNIKNVSHFLKNQKIGKETKYYKNGKEEEEGEYLVDNEKRKVVYKINQFWDKEGTQKVMDGNGIYQESSDFLLLTGNIKNGFKDGIWQGWVNNPKTKCTETYKNGEFVSGATIDEKGTVNSYSVLEKKPEPVNGINDFYKCISENFKISDFPPNTSGKIYIQFAVDVDGKMVEPRILRDLGIGTGQEALRVLKNCENWIPGEQRGIKVKCKYSLPISMMSAR